jgi:hypothetical protein
MKCIKLSIIVLVLAVLSVENCFSEILNYIGNDISDMKSGIKITTDKNKDVLIIANNNEKYNLILPYYGKAKVKINENGFDLYINFGLLNVSLNKTALNEKINSIDDLNKDFSNRKDYFKIISTANINFKDAIVLKTIQDSYLISKNEKLKDIKQINYYYYKIINSKKYLLHYSYLVRNNDIDQNTETDFLEFIVLGLDKN